MAMLGGCAESGAGEIALKHEGHLREGREANSRTRAHGSNIRPLGGAKVIFKLLLRKIAHRKHDQKKLFLSNAPTYKVCFHRVQILFLTSWSSPKARSHLDKAL